MSADDIEEIMLASSFDHFLSMISMIERGNFEGNNPSTVYNQIEMLKDILFQANIHLDCYRSHEKLLIQENGSLNNKHKSLQNEYERIKSIQCVNSLDNKTITSHIEQFEKQKEFIEDQLIKYKCAYQDLRTKEEDLVEQLTKTVHISKIKDLEIRNLTNEIENLRMQKLNTRKSIAKSNSEKKCGFDKNDIRPYTVSSYSLGVSQKSTTLESSRGSHSHL